MTSFIASNLIINLFEQKNPFKMILKGLFKKKLTSVKKLALQMMLRSLIPPLRGRISISALPTSAPLRPFPISSMRVPLDVRRPFSVGNSLPIENHVGGRGPFAAANSLRKPLSLQRPVQLASIIRLILSLDSDLLVTFPLTGTVPQIPMTRLRALESISKWKAQGKM